ncbi:MAG: ABC transporter ATP-binding protein, partial [Pseudomonadota bacterium]
SALDLRHQLDVLGQIRSQMIARDAVGVVALHDLNLAARFADRLVLLGDGFIRAQGPPSEVLSTSELASVYGVDIQVAQGPKQEISVHAYSP